MKIDSFLLMLASAIVALTACDNDDSSSIDDSVAFYQDYHVEYNITRNKTQVGANFNQNGKQGEYIRLTGNASVHFNGREPNYANIIPYFYTYTFAGLDKVIFSFTRNKGNDFINTASLSDVAPIAIPDDFTAIDTKTGTLLTWDGDPVSPGEEVQVTIVTNSGVGTIYNHTVGSKSIEVEYSLRSTASEATLLLSRIKTLPVQQSDRNAGGQIKVVYSDEKEIMLH